MMMNFNYKYGLAVAIVTVLSLSGCSDGSDGKDGKDGKDGTTPYPGLISTTADAHNNVHFHLEPANLNLKPGNPFHIQFSVTTTDPRGNETPLSKIDQVSLYVATQVENPTSGETGFEWRNPMIAEGKGYYMQCTPTGKASYMGHEFKACTLTEDPLQPGVYTGTWTHEGTAPVISDDYDANALHRVMLRAFNLVDNTGSPLTDKVLSTPIDFIPATGNLAISAKDSVSNASCQQCHGNDEGIINGLKAHENYQQVENCVLCHTKDIAQPDAINLKADKTGKIKGWNPNWPSMIHRLHQAKDLTGEAQHIFGPIGYPQKISECQTCHDNGESWLKPTVESCEACHAGFKEDAELLFDHSGLENNSICSQCHDSDSVQSAHKVGDVDAGIKALSLTLKNVEMDDSDTLTVIYQADGIEPGFDFGDYYAVEQLGATHGAEITLTEVTAEGFTDVHSHAALPADGIPVSDEKTITLQLENASQWRGKSALLAPHFAVCTSNGQPVKHDLDKKAAAHGHYTPICPDGATISPVAIAADVVLIGGTEGEKPFLLQTRDERRMTASTDKCNACHDDLSLPKMPYGLTDLAQCSQCHSPSAAGSYHGEVTNYITQADGSLVAEKQSDQFHNRDLVTVIHRTHSGAGSSLDREGLLLKDGHLQGYPESIQRCSTCHKQDAPFFNSDGRLASEKTSVSVEYPAFSGNHYEISPTAEACRSCHQHNTSSALAHFKSNGAVVTTDLNTAKLASAESCAVCHGEGKQYDINKVHANRDRLMPNH